MAREAHPGLPEFDYVKPKSLAEASQFLADHAGISRPLCGGTDTFVRLRDGAWKENKYLVDIKGLDGTRELIFDPVSGLTVGAAVNMNRISAFPQVREHYPLLAEACDTVAAYQLRSRATVVGNICNASPAGDTIGACLLYNGVLNVHGVDGIRQEPLPQQTDLCLKMLRKPIVDTSRFERVWKDTVHPLKDAYEMKP